MSLHHVDTPMGRTLVRSDERRPARARPRLPHRRADALPRVAHSYRRADKIAILAALDGKQIAFGDGLERFRLTPARVAEWRKTIRNRPVRPVVDDMPARGGQPT